MTVETDKAVVDVEAEADGVPNRGSQLTAQVQKNKFTRRRQSLDYRPNVVRREKRQTRLLLKWGWQIAQTAAMVLQLAFHHILAQILRGPSG